MNSYRVALILCRAVMISLWWSAGINFLSGLVLGLANASGLFARFGLSGFSLVNSVYLSLGGAVSLAVAATFLQLFAPTLSAAMTGGATLEGEAISSRRALSRDQRTLVLAGAGLILLIYGVANALPFTLNTAYTLLFGSTAFASGRAFMVYNLVSVLTPTILRCAVGFLLAFHLGLRRLIKPDAPEPLS